MKKQILAFSVYLLLPLVGLFLFVASVIASARFVPPNIPALIIAFVLLLVVEWYIFQTRVLTHVLRVEKIQKLLEDQDRSGKLLIRRDLELTQANEKLRALDARKSEFVSVVAHQLRTPLSGIKWTLNMLLNGELGPLSVEQKTFLMKSYESNERMVALVDDMLSADRIESGKFQYNLVPTQLLDVFDNVLYELHPIALKKEIKVEFVHRDPQLPQVLVDQEKIRAVIQNLLENAVKYTPAHGTISIELTRQDGFIRVAIKDSGIGIPRDQHSNVFKRFFRAKNALHIETDGSGLGLFIARGIIEKHGGTIWFESKENHGTTFYFTVKSV